MYYTKAEEISLDKIMNFTKAMEHLDDYSHELSFYKMYKSPDSIKKFIIELLKSKDIETIRKS